MKSILFTLFLVVFTTAVSGQEHNPAGITSGKITFEEKVKLDIKIEGEGAQMAAMLPKERKTEKILTFTEEATLFEDGNNNAEDEMAPQHSEGGAVRIRMIVSGDNKTYTDLKNKKVIEQRDFMNRIFLVEKELPETSWKVTGNQKVILNYPCMEAVKLDTAGNKTVAWFAPSIKNSGGPAGLGNLPGMILEVDMNNGTRTLTATSIEPLVANGMKIGKPKDGKKVSEDEYKVIVAEKMKEMGIEQGESGGGTQMRIVIKH
jgi:GLPGLI family protein